MPEVIYGKNFKPKLCMCAQSMALGTCTKFQLKILKEVQYLQFTYFERISYETLVKQIIGSREMSKQYNNIKT